MKKLIINYGENIKVLGDGRHFRFYCVRKRQFYDFIFAVNSNSVTVKMVLFTSGKDLTREPGLKLSF